MVKASRQGATAKIAFLHWALVFLANSLEAFVFSSGEERKEIPSFQCLWVLAVEKKKLQA
jgi:hypothetical protein